MVDTIVVFGSTGMLGRYVYSYFTSLEKYTVISVSRKDFEVSQENLLNLESFLQSKNINSKHCIINCLGSIPQRYTSKDTTNYFTVNSIFPLLLAKICLKYNAKCIHPSTDCVYDGMKGKYLETDYHDEINAYGQSKSLGESPYITILRASIIGEELSNKKSFLEWVKNSSGTISGWNNHFWNGITCLQWCKIAEHIIHNNLFWQGVRHIYSPTPKSKYELANDIKNVYNLDIQIEETVAKIECDKTLASLHSTNMIFNIPELYNQIQEQSVFKLIA